MIEMLIEARRRDLGGFEVGRVLPVAKRRMVGPFVFFDHMGPIDMPAAATALNWAAVNCRMPPLETFIEFVLAFR